MKKFTLLMAILLVSCFSFGQGSENFDNATSLPTGTTYGDGLFVGNDGITWHYVHSQAVGSYPINGNGILLRRSNEPSSLSATIQGGIGSFSLDTRKGYSSNTQRKLELVINGDVVEQFEPDFPSGESDMVIPFVVEDINISGEVTLELRMYGATGNQHIVLDNISWTGYTSGTGDLPYSCNQITPGTLEDGLFLGGDDNQLLAIDIPVYEGTTFEIESIKINTVDAATYFNILIHEDNSGVPGAVVSTFNAVPITGSTIVGNNFGYDFYQYTLDISGENLVLNAPTGDTRYWMQVQSDALAWESVAGVAVGLSGAYANDDSLGVWTIGGGDYVYELIGECTGEIPITYCNGSASDCDYDSITNVTFAGINNTTGCTAGTNDYTNLIATVAQGETHQISVAIEADSDEYIHVFIDWNQNGVLDDTGESYLVASGVSVSQSYTLNIVVPIDAALGETRMRVFLGWDEPMLLPCDSIMYGEVEDYTVNVTSAAACPPPSALSHTQLSMNSVELSWTGTGSLFNLEWGTQGFTPGTGTLVTDLTTASYQLTGITTDTIYEFYVLQDCGTDGESNWTGPYSFSVGYCEAGANYEDDEKIANVTFVDINNNSTSLAGYENFTSVSTDVAQGETYTFSTTLSNYYESDEMMVWIDYNQDGDFDDLGELVLTLIFSSASDFGNITIPADATLGTTRMRVRLHYSDYEGNTTPCGNSEYGQVEDYTINIIDPCTAGSVIPLFNQVATVCAGQSLSALPTTSTNGITGTWLPALDNTQTTTYTFTPDSGQCATTASMTITVIPNEVPDFDPIADICEGEFLAELPTTSTNGITGTWLPALDNTQTTTYTFTPDLGQCATTASLTITVTPNVIPEFDPIADICEGEFLAELPTTSTNGITGTWLPALDNTQTTTYTFTPDLGQCATTASVTIVVNDAPDSPTADSPQMLTEGQTVADIVVTGVTGTLNWYSDEDLTNNVEESMMLVEGAYTFWVTQTVGNCTSSATEITVEVSLSRNVFDQASFRVYPNPVREILNISYSKDITDVTVINMLGQVVISQTASSADTQVDMSVLPTGSYLVKVTVDGIAKTIKVIKQ